MARGYALIDGELKEKPTSLTVSGCPSRDRPCDGSRHGAVQAGTPSERSHRRLMLSHASAITMRQTLFRFDPRINGMAHGFMEMDRNGERIVGHIGSAAPLYYSVLSLFPDGGMASLSSTMPTPPVLLL